MKLSKLPVLLLMGALIGPWTAASAEPCDDVLIRRAGFMMSKRAQTAALQLVTPEAFDSLKAGLTGQMRLLDRRLSDFGSFESLNEWRTKEAVKESFKHGLDSARAAILAGTSEDSYSLQWKKCQLDSASSQSPPSLRGWLERLEPDSATVRLLLVAEPGDAAAPAPQIVVEPPSDVRVGDAVTSRTPQGKSMVDRLVTVARSPEGDIRLTASISTSRTSLVVPASTAGASNPPPVTQSIDSPSLFLREPINRVVSVSTETGRSSDCIYALRGEVLDLSTVRVTPSSNEGYWEITAKSPQRVCVAVGVSEKTPYRSKTPYFVILRVDKLRARPTTD